MRVNSPAERAIRDGHPWLFEGSIREMSASPDPGAVGVVFDRKNRFLAAGLLDPLGPIRLRILVVGRPARIGEELFRSRLQEAIGLRRPLLEDPDTTGIRLVSGENDRLPGLVADLYGETLVLKLYSLAWIPRLRELLPALLAACSPSAVLVLSARRLGAGGASPSDSQAPFSGEPFVLHGELPAGGALPFLEHGLRLEAHPLQGQKTGFYLDQRENRSRVEAWVREERSRRDAPVRVLNVFSYTGGFSLAAARGGAAEVVSLDSSGPALRQAERHFHLNGDDPSIAGARHRSWEGDAFQRLAEARTARKRFQVVVLDPPSFARDASQVAGALESYGRLTALALPLLEPGGLLVQASCTARVDPDAFRATVLQAGERGGRSLTLLEETGHPLDHPVGFPEGAYLKCLYLRA